MSRLVFTHRNGQQLIDSCVDMTPEQFDSMDSFSDILGYALEHMPVEHLKFDVLAEAAVGNINGAGLLDHEALAKLRAKRIIEEMMK